jgi:hypothetical protein
MTFEDRNQLVIHDGKLMPKNTALALMTEEFIPFGYTIATIEMLMERTYAATQKFLHELSFTTPAERCASPEAALKRAAGIANRWRAQTPEARRGHAQYLETERVKREAFEQERRERYRREQEEMRKRREELLKEARKTHWKAQWEKQFNDWEDRCEGPNWKEGAANVADG